MKLFSNVRHFVTNFLEFYSTLTILNVTHSVDSVSDIYNFMEIVTPFQPLHTPNFGEEYLTGVAARQMKEHK